MNNYHVTKIDIMFSDPGHGKPTLGSTDNSLTSIVIFLAQNGLTHPLSLQLQSLKLSKIIVTITILMMIICCTHPVAFVAAAAHVLFKLSHFPDNDHIDIVVGGDGVDLCLHLYYL